MAEQQPVIPVENFGINKVILVGKVTNDTISFKTLPSGTSLLTLRIVTRNEYNDSVYSEFHKVSVFGKLAEDHAEAFQEGDIVMVVGRLSTRSWESDGRKQYITETVASEIKIIAWGGE